MEKEKPQEEKKNVMARAELISLVFNLGFAIAIPIALFTYLGHLLDKHSNSSPLFILIGSLFAVAISSFLVYKKISKLI